MSAPTKAPPPNSNLLGLRIIGKWCCQKQSMLLIALLFKTDLRETSGLDDRSHVERLIFICASRAAKPPVPGLAGRPVLALSCCTPHRMRAVG